MVGVSFKNHHAVSAARSIIEALMKKAVADFALVRILQPAMGSDGIATFHVFEPAVAAKDNPDTIAVWINAVIADTIEAQIFDAATIHMRAFDQLWAQGDLEIKVKGSFERHFASTPRNHSVQLRHAALAMITAIRAGALRV